MTVSRLSYLLALVLAAPLIAATPSRSEQGAADAFVGNASCSSTSCHGSATPRTNTRLDLNEARIWGGLAGGKPDKHANAFKVLGDPFGTRIAKNLGLGKATEAARCLACHSPSAADDRRGPLYTTNEGVACENCHGAGARWLDSHAKGASHAENVKLGMIDTKDIARRAAQCLKCHLGSGDRRVDHELIAAGHPDLTFELDTYTATMPPHWKTSHDPLEHLRNWAIGQASQLKAQMEYVVLIAGDGRWPDYARLDCAACHHPIQAPTAQWRLSQDKHGRTPGRPPFNAAQYALFSHLAHEVNPGQAASLDHAYRSAAATLTGLQPGRSAASDSASRAATEATGLLSCVEAQKYDAAFAHRLLKSVTKDGDAIANLGPRAALQTVWLIDMLLRVPHETDKHGGAYPDDVKSLMEDLYHQVDHLSEFNAPHFAASLKRIATWAERLPAVR